MLMSEPEVTIDAVAELLPPAVVPPLVSLVAPVLMATDDVPDAVGVPLTEQLMLPPGGTLAGGVGEQPVTVTPGGRPKMEHVAAIALAVALALLVHNTVPL